MVRDCGLLPGSSAIAQMSSLRVVACGYRVRNSACYDVYLCHLRVCSFDWQYLFENSSCFLWKICKKNTNILGRINVDAKNVWWYLRDVHVVDCFNGLVLKWPCSDARNWLLCSFPIQFDEWYLKNWWFQQGGPLRSLYMELWVSHGFTIGL